MSKNAPDTVTNKRLFVEKGKMAELVQSMDWLKNPMGPSEK